MINEDSIESIIATLVQIKQLDPKMQIDYTAYEKMFFLREQCTIKNYDAEQLILKERKLFNKAMSQHMAECKLHECISQKYKEVKNIIQNKVE